MSDMTTIARPYAKAAFDFAIEKDTLEHWGQMLTFATEVTNNEQIHECLTGLMVSDKLVAIFVHVCGEQVDQYGHNLLKLMAMNGRLAVLPEVCKQFFLLKQEQEKEIDVAVISATDLSIQQQTDISEKLELRLERKVKLTCSIDESLLGGVIIRAGDLVIDNSARGRLSRLSDTLQS